MKLLLAVMLLTLCCSVAQTQEKSRALEYYKKAESSPNEQEAFQYFEKAIIQAKKDKDWPVYLKTLHQLMSIVGGLDKDQTNQVFSWMKESLLVQEMNAGPLTLAGLHFNCALFYRHKSTLKDSALYHYASARMLRTKVLGEWHESVAACYHGAGDIYKYYKNEFNTAEEYYEKALRIRERTRTAELNVLAENYYSLAATNRSQHDFQKAISYGSKTIELVEKTKDIQLLERTYTIVANIYRDMGESATAKEYYNKAIALNLEAKNSREDLAWQYLSLGETLKNDAMFEEAIRTFLKARSIYDRIEEENKELYIYCLYQMAETYLLNKDFKNSIKTYRHLVNALEALGMLEGRQAAEAFSGLGNYYSDALRYDSALFYYQRALNSAIKSFHPASDENPSTELIGNNFYIHRILNKKASLFKTLFHTLKDPLYLRKALQCLVLSEELLVKERNSLDMEDSKWKFLDANYNVYEQIIAVAYTMYQVNPQDSILRLAFHYFEKSKSRSLADALTEAERSGDINISDSLFRYQNDLKKAVFRVQDELTTVPGKSVSQADEIARLRGEIVKLDRQIQRNKLAIENKYPGYFKVKYSDVVQPLKEVREQLRKKDQILLEYFFGNESVYGLGISGHTVLLKRLAPADSLHDLIRSYTKHFRDNGSSLDKDVFKSFTNNSHALYQLLAEPFLSSMPEGKRIVVIPDGPIGRLPFETLLETPYDGRTINYRDLKYLLNTYVIGYAYSSVSLFNASENKDTTPSVLAMAFSGGVSSNNAFQTIRGADNELKMLSQKLDGGKFLKGGDASELNFKKLAPSFDIIHLAVHGQGDLQKDNASSLYFTSLNDSPEDSELHAYELYGLKLKARLVVLSACETGLGKAYKGEGMLSMANAFAYAGCENILLSLWKVNDNASTRLIGDFYDALLKGREMDEAITLAKRKYLDQADELSADPGVWAPLVAYGNLDPVFEKNKNRTYLVIFLGVFVILFLLYVRRRNKN